MAVNILPVKNRTELRAWFTLHAAVERECWVVLKRGHPTDDIHFWYLDAVEEALCFGWIDSTLGMVDGVRMQRFAPRKKGSHWTELNRARVRRLEMLGLMTDAGRAVVPDREFAIDPAVERDIREAGLWETFQSFPLLYQRVRADNLSFARSLSSKDYAAALASFVKKTSQGKMYGQWNDYGRLLTGPFSDEARI